VNTNYYYKCISCKRIFDKPFSKCSYCKGLIIIEYSSLKFEVNKTRQGIWRYSSLLPKFSTLISKGEGLTPLIKIDKENNVYIKNEKYNPAGTYVDRSSAVIASYISENDIKRIGILYSEDFTLSLAYYLNDRSIEIFVDDIIKMDFNELTKFLSMKISIKPKSNVNEGINVFEYMNPLTVEGLKTILFEIYEKNANVENIVVPAETGILAFSLYKGLKELCNAGLDVPYNVIAVMSRDVSQPNIIMNLKDIKIIKVDNEEIVTSFVKLYEKGIKTKPLSAMSYIVAENLKNSVAVITMGFKTSSTFHVKKETLRDNVMKILKEKGPMTAYQIWNEYPHYTLRGIYKALKNMELKGEVEVSIRDKGLRKVKYYKVKRKLVF
jgi:threonine synthase